MQALCNRYILKYSLAILALGLGGNAVCGQDSGLNEPIWTQEEPYRIAAKYFCETDSAVGYLIIQVELAEGRYLYSLTQPGKLATTIEVSFGGNAKSAGVLRPLTPPETKENDEFLQGRSEKHFGAVQFVLPIRPSSDVPPQKWKVAVRVNGQVCSETGTCQLIQDHVTSARYEIIDTAMRQRLAAIFEADSPIRR